MRDFRNNPAWRQSRLPLIVILLGGMATVVCGQEAKTNYEDHVKSILRQRCASCHGPDSRKGDLDVTNFTNLMQGGSSGAVIEPGDPDGSYLYSLVTHEDEPVMPPGGKIPEAEMDLIRQWIESGALENQGSKAVMTKKPSAIAMGENPLNRPESVPSFPRLPLEPVQHTELSPVTASMDTSPWAPLLAVAGKHQVVLYDTQRLQMIGVLPFPEGTVNVVSFSRSGAVLLAGGGHAGSSGVAVLWDVRSGERIATVGDELDAVLAADISPDHSLVALGGPGSVVNVYATDSGELKYSLRKHTDWITSLAFSTDGVLLATGDRNGGLHVWESWTGREYLTLNGHTESIQDIAWRGDSNVVASASGDTTIKLWELNNGAQIKSWGAHGGGVHAITFTRDGRILSAGDDQLTKLWAQDGNLQSTFPAFEDQATAVAWCDESQRALAGDYRGEIRVWNPQDGAQLGLLSPNPPTLAARLAAAQTHRDTLQQQWEPLRQQVTETTTAAAEMATQLQVAVATRDAAQSAMDELQNSLALSNQKTNQLTAQIQETQSLLVQLNEAQPLLAQALSHLSQAAQKLPADETLQAQVNGIQQKLTLLETQQAEAQTALGGLQIALTEATSQVKATDEQAQATAENLASSQSQVDALNRQLEPMVQARDAAAAELQAVQQAIDAAQVDLERWQAEIQFVNHLNELNERLAAARARVLERQHELEQANQVVKEAQEKSAAIQQTVQEAEASAAQIRAAIQAARELPR